MAYWTRVYTVQGQASSSACFIIRDARLHELHAYQGSPQPGLCSCVPTKGSGLLLSHPLMQAVPPQTLLPGRPAGLNGSGAKLGVRAWISARTTASRSARPRAMPAPASRAASRACARAASCPAMARLLHWPDSGWHALQHPVGSCTGGDSGMQWDRHMQKRWLPCKYLRWTALQTHRDAPST